MRKCGLRPVVTVFVTLVFIAIAIHSVEKGLPKAKRALLVTTLLNDVNTAWE